MNQAASRAVVEDLRERLRQLERSQRRGGEASRSTGTALDGVVPGGGLTGGTLVEWLAEGEGSGTATLALVVSAHRLQMGGCLVVVDGKREFYPPGAAGLGIPLERTIVVQPASARDALWALEQALRCPAVAVTLGESAVLSNRTFRRLQLAAETGGGLGFLLRPVSCRGEPSWAELRLLVRAAPWPGPGGGRRLHVEVLHCRGGAAGKAVELELSHEANPVRVAAALADSALAARASGA